MTSPQIASRLIPGIAPEYEWRCLVNETLSGERAIVPLLRGIVSDPSLPKELRDPLKRQIDEEIEHVRLFHGLVGREKLIGSGYEIPFSRYVQSLPSITLKLFALQGMLEGIALGALWHRLHRLENSPSESVDRRAYAEELEHVEFSLPFLSPLSRAEGKMTLDSLEVVAAEVSAIFTSHFNGYTLSRFVKENLGVEATSARDLDATPAIRDFRVKSARCLAVTKHRFIDAYKKAIT